MFEKRRSGLVSYRFEICTKIVIYVSNFRQLMNQAGDLILFTMEYPSIETYRMWHNS